MLWTGRESESALPVRPAFPLLYPLTRCDQRQAATTAPSIPVRRKPRPSDLPVAGLTKALPDRGPAALPHGREREGQLRDGAHARRYQFHLCQLCASSNGRPSRSCLTCRGCRRQGGSQGFDTDDGSSFYHIHDNIMYAADGMKMDCKSDTDRLMLCGQPQG